MRSVALTIVLVLWGCEGLLDEQAASTLSDPNSGDANVMAAVLVGVEMKDSSDAGRKAHLRIQRDSDGNPTCVDFRWVADANSTQYTVELEKRGEGEWRVKAESAAADATYDRYYQKSSAVLNITLHWTKARGNLQADNMTNAQGRLEYLAASFNEGNQYEYQNDIDGKSSLTIGSLLKDTPNASVFTSPSCSS